MREPGNISRVVSAGHPDFLGFIFYPPSKRFVGFEPLPEVRAVVPDAVTKVGVFVDETPEKVLLTSQRWDLQAVQLHGNESPEFCAQMQRSGLIVIKAFSIDESFDFGAMEAYANSCDFFLFDTKSPLPGGSGQKFNWHLLSNYQLNVPFFLSGGIGPEDVNAIRELSHDRFFGVDVNSGFETSPAMKDVEKVGKFICEIRE